MERRVVLEGSFDRPGIAAWFALAFGALLVAATISFIASGDTTVVVYPLAFSVVPLVLFVFAFLRSARYRLTSREMTITRRVGAERRIAFTGLTAQVHDKDMKPYLRLITADGAKLTLRRLTPAGAAGRIWFCVRFAHLLDAEALQEIVAGVPPAAPGAAPIAAVRVFSVEGKRKYGDFGFMAVHGDRAAYVPNSTTDKAGNVVAGIAGAVIGVGVFRFLKLSDEVEPQHIPAAAFARAMGRATVSLERAFPIWEEVARHCGGSVLERSGDRWIGIAGRFEVTVVPS